MELTPIEDIASSSISAEAKKYGITHSRFIASGGEGEMHISIWGLTGPDGIEFRVARTNGDPVWEEQDLGEFAELLKSVGLSDFR